MSVLHDGCEHWDEFRTDGFGVGAEDTRLLFAPPRDCPRRAAAHSPARLHLCAVSDRWSRQKVCLQDSQRKGKKSS